jgi:hypothetical protein
MGNCWQLSNNWEGVVETPATLSYYGQLLATQQQLVETLATQATVILYLMIFMPYDSYMKV